MATPTTNTKEYFPSPPPPPPPPTTTTTTTTITTYVQAEPSTFREVVQRLTGAPEGSRNNLSLPLALAHHHHSARPHKRQRLQERRHAPTKLEIKLSHLATRYRSHLHHHHHHHTGAEKGCCLTSPVSTIDASLFPSPSPTTPWSEEVEKRVILEKGFYLHPSPRSGDSPKLLSLFPLHSPMENS